MPESSRTYDGYFNASPECWSVFGEVLAAEYGNAPLFARVHQLTVDAYAVQHAGGPHPDKSVCVHLVGLHLVLDRGLRPMNVPPQLQRLASAIDNWPHFDPPAERGRLTAFDVALADDADGHAEAVRRWAGQVWMAWGAHHAAVAAIADAHFGTLRENSHADGRS
jgi:hypothetical protein